jgi:hypothetical protein
MRCSVVTTAGGTTSHLEFRAWLAENGFEQFEEKMLSYKIGVRINNWRKDIKELDNEICINLGMSVLQAKKFVSQAWLMPAN